MSIKALTFTILYSNFIQSTESIAFFSIKNLLKLADLNQDNIDRLPIGSREHKHLRPKFELSTSSNEVIVGRLDAKGTGQFYNSYVPKKTKFGQI